MHSEPERYLLPPLTKLPRGVRYPPVKPQDFFESSIPNAQILRAILCAMPHRQSLARRCVDELIGMVCVRYRTENRSLNILN